MKNIFILGNGFDLAHGYKTDYRSFIEDVIVKEKLVKIYWHSGKVNIDDVEFENYDLKCDYKNRENIKLRRKELQYDSYTLKTDNYFLKEVISKSVEPNWGGIESQYFELLTKKEYGEGGELIRKTDPQKLNREFEEVKKELEVYLIQFHEMGNPLKEFSQLFKVIGSASKNLILNFNYTNTFQRFYETQCKCEVVNIHGQLDSKLNPIIFGYAPTTEETQTLINENDNEYLKNIKKYYYKQTENENQLYSFLGDKTGFKINVFVIGHSCGISDRKILNDVFTHFNVQNINIVYYKDYNNYFDTLVNIDRVIGEETKHGVVRSFELSLACPQSNDTEEIKHMFNSKLIEVKRNIEELKEKVDIR